MIDFTYYNPTKIMFGKNSDADVGAVLKNHTQKLLLHYGGGSILKNGVYERVTKSLKNHNISYFELPGVVPNPRLSLVREGIEIVKRHNINFVLAVGGGSVIDSAKAICAGAVYDGDVWDFFARKTFPSGAIGLGTVLTIMAAGSESSDSCVISNDQNNLKRALSCEHFYPRISFVNPQNTMSLPKYQIACGASDILAHLLERYFTKVPNVEYVDSLIEASIRAVLKFGLKSYQNIDDYDAREQLVWVGTIAHNNSLSAGRLGDWGSHNIEHELSAMFDLAHGAGLSIIFPAWIKYTAHVDISRIERLLREVFNQNETGDNAVNAVITNLKNWYKAMDLPVSFKDANISEDSIPALVNQFMVGRTTLGNYYSLTAKDIENIYKLAR